MYVGGLISLAGLALGVFQYGWRSSLTYPAWILATGILIGAIGLVLVFEPVTIKAQSDREHTSKNE